MDEQVHARNTGADPCGADPCGADPCHGKWSTADGCASAPTPRVCHAAGDYRWLLDRGYPDQPALKLVGDRYRLTRVERGMLYRGVFSSADSIRRARRLVEVDGTTDDAFAPGAVRVSAEDAGTLPDLTVDGHNVLFTVWNCLAGRPLVAATDRFVRDIGGTRSRLPKGERFTHLARILCDALQRLPTGSISVFLDEPLPWSREHAAELRRIWHERCESAPRAPRDFVVETEIGVDARIARTATGWIATSDTGIIDRCSLPVLDLGGYTVRSSFRTAPTVLIM